MQFPPVLIASCPCAPATMTIKRKAAPEDGAGISKRTRAEMDVAERERCGKVLEELMNHPKAMVFCKPFDSLPLSMDLGKVKRRLESGWYVKADEFTGDIRLTFANGILYNRPGNKIHMFARELKEFFVGMWDSGNPATPRTLEKIIDKGTPGSSTESDVTTVGSNGSTSPGDSQYAKAPDADSHVEKPPSSTKDVVLDFLPETKAWKQTQRAIDMKKRFHDIIFKSTHQSVEDRVKESHPAERFQERQRYEKELQKEKRDFEAEIKAAEDQLKDLGERIEEQRVREREALEKMNPTVSLDNSSAMEDMKMLCGWPTSRRW